MTAGRAAGGQGAGHGPRSAHAPEGPPGRGPGLNRAGPEGNREAEAAGAGGHPAPEADPDSLRSLPGSAPREAPPPSSPSRIEECRDLPRREGNPRHLRQAARQIQQGVRQLRTRSRGPRGGRGSSRPPRAGVRRPRGRRRAPGRQDPSPVPGSRRPGTFPSLPKARQDRRAAGRASNAGRRRRGPVAGRGMRAAGRIRAALAAAWTRSRLNADRSLSLSRRS
jgi:hypothetical protein